MTHNKISATVSLEGREKTLFIYSRKLLQFQGSLSSETVIAIKGKTLTGWADYKLLVLRKTTRNEIISLRNYTEIIKNRAS